MAWLFLCGLARMLNFLSSPLGDLCFGLLRHGT